MKEPFDQEDESRSSEFEWDFIPAMHCCPACGDACRCDSAIIKTDGHVLKGTCEHDCS